MSETEKLGPLAPLIEDLDITEILVNSYNAVFVERRGNVLEEVPGVFKDEGELWAVVEQIRVLAEAQGRRLDKNNPMVDLRLGAVSGPQDRVTARCNVVLPPISAFGPTITIRKFAQYRLNAEDLLKFGTWDEDILHFLRVCVAGRLNIVMAGGTGSGKTTVLNNLIGMIPADERIITIENALELQPPTHLKHVVRLESRPPDHEGQGEVSIRELVINALRMRPDRLVLGEARASEVLDILQAINTGHDGSMFSVHAASLRDVLTRLETMATMHDITLPLLTVRQMLADAIDLIIYQERLGDGRRKIMKIAEVTGMQGDTIQTRDIFEFRETGLDADERITGFHTATGYVPEFVARLRTPLMKSYLHAQGLDLSLSLFTPKE